VPFSEKSLACVVVLITREHTLPPASRGVKEFYLGELPGQGDMHSVFEMGHVHLVSPAQVYLRGFRLVKLSSDTLDDAQRVRLVAIFFDIIFLRAILNISQSTSSLCLNRLHLIYLRRMALFGIGVAAALCQHSFPQLNRC
jgi:hypothetical protein